MTVIGMKLAMGAAMKAAGKLRNHTIYPTRDMSMEEFTKKVNEIKTTNPGKIDKGKGLMAIGGLRRLPPEVQTAILRDALKSDQELDAMEYLRTVEDPAVPSSLEVAPLLVAELGSIAAYLGENAPVARAYLGTLARIPSRRDTVLAMAERRTADCLAHPEDARRGLGDPMEQAPVIGASVFVNCMLRPKSQGTEGFHNPVSRM